MENFKLDNFLSEKSEEVEDKKDEKYGEDKLKALKESINNTLQLLELMENGMSNDTAFMLDFSPVFEAVDRSDKKNIKSIVSKLYPEFKLEFGTSDYYFLRFDRCLEQLLRFFFGGIPFIPFSNILSMIVSSMRSQKDKDFNENWQIIGLVSTAKDIDEVTKSLNEKYADTLGEKYTLKSKKTFQMWDEFLLSALSGKFKKDNKAYFLYVDKK